MLSWGNEAAREFHELSALLAENTVFELGREAARALLKDGPNDHQGR